MLFPPLGKLGAAMLARNNPGSAKKALAFRGCEVLEGGAGSHAGESGMDVVGLVGGCTVGNPLQLGTMSARGRESQCALSRQSSQYHFCFFVAVISQHIVHAHFLYLYLA